MPCRAEIDGCTENHSKHYCKNCKKTDASHKSANCYHCPLIVLHCKASKVGCSENHSRHYCKVCKDRDSNHKSANCPIL